ncbi:hypothetical protein [Myxococcus virescens]|uniref:Uncharacterized protein n=1 Tax=Myxococcus virescens TaxID=83456 RepID=A0A511HM07_9BACT|nr:hypothetical protein [Myxococcus virescens]GEL74641.1 hypothetical protein MVI01_64250 [Myxococcus virescens]SDE54869.1 hypothetical protein SAMN04488504_108169 [Myxococcus virescens]
MTCIRFEVPIKAQSTSNLREHWAAKHKRTDAQKAATRRRCPEWKAGPLLFVRLTRVAPRALDDDNLRGALKSVRDAVATWLRVDDRSPLVGWLYAQAKGPEPLVTVEVGWGDGPLAKAARDVHTLEALELIPEFPTLQRSAQDHLPQARATLAAVDVEPRRPAKAKVVKELAALATSASYRSTNTRKP